MNPVSSAIVHILRLVKTNNISILGSQLMFCSGVNPVNSAIEHILRLDNTYTISILGSHYHYNHNDLAYVGYIHLSTFYIHVSTVLA